MVSGEASARETPDPSDTVSAPINRGGLVGKLRRNERATTFVAAVVVGVCGGACALAFRGLVDLSWRLFESLRGAGPLGYAALLALPALGGIAAAYLGRTVDETPGDHGMVGIKASLITGGGVLRIGLALRKVAACALTTSAGGSAGCEGPIARVAGAVGSTLARFLGLHRARMQVLVACGVSASLAGLFGTPIAAVVFATEVILGGYAMRSLAPLIVSAATATALVRVVVGRGAAFSVPSMVLTAPTDLLAHAVLGVLCGGVAALFVHTLDRVETFWARLPLPGTLRPALGGLFVGAIALAVPGVLGVGYPSLDTVLSGKLAGVALATLLAAKLVATTSTLGSGGAGGIFAPSLLMGASLGSLVGDGANRIWPGVFAPSPTFAAVGMAAMTAAVTHAPFTGVVLLIELTRSYNVVLPGAVAVIVAGFVSSSIRDDSAYTMRLNKRGLREPKDRHTTTLTEASIAGLVVPMREALPSDLSASALMAKLPFERAEALFVVSADDGKAVGVVHVADALASGAKQGTVADWMVETGSVRRDDTVARALVLFMAHRAPSLPVVDDDGKPIGLVRRVDVMDFCAHDMLRGTLDLGGAALPQVCDKDGGGMGRPLAHQVSALPAPSPFVGKTLRELDLGKRYGVACVGLRRATDAGAFAAIPLDLALVLRRDDVLILTGSAEATARLRGLGREMRPSQADLRRERDSDPR